MVRETPRRDVARWRQATQGHSPVRSSRVFQDDARARGVRLRRNFLTVKGPELYSKWVGDSEKAVRSLFARARASAPSVVFLDELDGLVGARSSGGGEGPSVHDRLLTQLLSEMDGLQTGRGDASDAVAVVAATNRPDLVDAALLRPGRFDRLLFIPPPRAAEDRAEILRVKLATHARGGGCEPRHVGDGGTGIRGRISRRCAARRR